MDLAKNRATVSHEMSTKNVGSILPMERSTLKGWRGMPGGRNSRNAFEEPSDYVFGPNGRVGGNDPCNTNDADGDFDFDPGEDWD